jgi:predicted peptidase
MRSLTILLVALLVGCGTPHDTNTKSSDSFAEEQLLRHAYTSVVDSLERDAYIYLPRGYDDDSSYQWPVMIYLHGDGERGDGKEELDYVMAYGPLYEAWVQKMDMPFILIVPQLHMLGRDGPDGPSYILNRTKEGIPRRLEEGAPPRNRDTPALQNYGPMQGAVSDESLPDWTDYDNKFGWKRTDPDVVNILDSILETYNADADRVYLTGASEGAFGVWYYSSVYPERFAALLPVVGYPSIEQAEAVAKADIPVWIFSGGRDPTVETKYFFAGMNRMDELGATIRFTTEQDMWHDVWNRVYAGDDVYNWLLQYRKH